jgi:hypothetical protein
MRGIRHHSKEDLVLKTRCISVAAILMFCAACARTLHPQPQGTRALSVGRPRSCCRSTLPRTCRADEVGACDHSTGSGDPEDQRRPPVDRHKLIASNIYNVVASHIHQGAAGVGPAVFLYGNAAPGVAGMTACCRPERSPPPAWWATGGAAVLRVDRSARERNAYANVHTNDGVGATNTGPGDFRRRNRGQLRR